MVVFATAGKPDSYGKRKFPQELPDYLGEFGLNGFEVQCGRGINISKDACDFFRKQTKISLSLHTPYFISISSVDEAIRQKSIGTILESAETARKIGANRIVVHSGSCAKISRDDALELALDTLKKARELLDKNGLDEIIICPETMGKINQLGNLGEVLELCAFDERMLPCIDFGHLNAREHGKISYKSIFDEVESKIGTKRMKHLHMHFSKIEHSAGGEKKHLTFEDNEYGPDFEPMLDEIAARGLEPFIVCESAGTQAEDCAAMKKYYEERLEVCV
ncbi:MAG: TIM barrel protein [Oscillospiraceae bacterium]|nr:TIM barrel protein [Oscillospiraceae bacterium]